MVDKALLFEWDEVKSARTKAVRGFDFNYATQIFKGEVLEEEDRRRNYGERRFLAIGEEPKEICSS
jgi:uncharacterized DUF497 family protein